MVLKYAQHTYKQYTQTNLHQQHKSKSKLKSVPLSVKAPSS